MKQDVQAQVSKIAVTPIKVPVAPVDTKALKTNLAADATVAGAAAGRDAGVAFQKGFASASPSVKGLLQRSGIADEFAAYKVAAKDAARVGDELDAIRRKQTDVTKGASAFGGTLRSIGTGAVLFGLAAAVNTVGDELRDADGAAGHIGDTLEGLQTLDLVKTFDGVASTIRDIDDASGGWISTLNDGLNEILNNVIPGLGSAIADFEGKLGSSLAVINELNANAKNLQTVSVLPTSQADINNQTRKLLRERQIKLREALGINDPQGLQFSAAGRAKQREQTVVFGGDLAELTKELAQVTGALTGLNKPLQVQASPALLRQLAVGQGTGDVDAQRSALAQLIKQFTKQLSNPNLTDAQLQGVGEALARFKAQLESINRAQAAQQPDAAATTPFGVRRQVDVNVARAQAGGSDNQIVSALEERIALDRKQIGQQEALLKRGGANAGQHAETLKKLYADLQSSEGQIQSIRDAAQREAERIANEAARRATEAQQRYQALIRRRETALQNALDATAATPGLKDDQKARDKLIAFYKTETTDAKLITEERQRYQGELLSEQATARQLRQTEKDALAASIAAAVQRRVERIDAIKQAGVEVAAQQKETRELRLQNDVAAAEVTGSTSKQRKALLALRAMYVQIRKDAGVLTVDGEKARQDIIGIDRQLKALTKDTSRVIVQGVVGGVDLIINATKDGAKQVQSSLDRADTAIKVGKSSAKTNVSTSKAGTAITVSTATDKPQADPATVALRAYATAQAARDALQLAELRKAVALLQRIAGGGPTAAAGVGSVATIAGSLTGAQGRAWAMSERGLGGNGGQ